MALDDPRASLGPTSVPGSASIAGIDAPQRGAVYGTRFAVATDHPLVTLTALNILQRGGNAADAAIAAAFANAVTKPHRTTLGGDAFSLVWRRNENVVDCLNAGGRAPQKADLAAFPNGIPELGASASTVPGLIDALFEMHQTYATLPMDEPRILPAITLAEEGFPVSHRLSWAMSMLLDAAGPGNDAMRDAFLKDGRPYLPGDLFRQPDLAHTLRIILDEADYGREGFYAGATGEAMSRAMREAGGHIDKADLESPTAHWHEPLLTTYRGVDVYEQALPSQGIILLEALNIVEQFPMADWGPGHADAVHVLVEAMKLAFADSRRYTADPAFETVPVEQLLSKEHARARAAQIDMHHAGAPGPALVHSDTTEFAICDGSMAVSFIQSVFSAWGSRFVVPGTGILMNNRLRAFSTDPESVNRLVPGKQTVHTLNTFMALRDGQLIAGGGTPGMDFQVQNNLQTLVGIIDWGLDLQAAIDMPRWANIEDGLAMEGRFRASVLDDLRSRGHNVLRIADWDGTIARSQLVSTSPNGSIAAASDLRGEGVALAL